MATRKAVFKDGVEAAIIILSTRVPATLGHYCSASELKPVSAPNASQKLFIEKLEAEKGQKGTFAAGVEHAVDVMKTYEVGRGEQPGAWQLVPSEGPDVSRQMFIAAMQRLINPDG